MEITLIIKQSIVSSTEFLLDNEKQRTRRSQLCELKARQTSYGQLECSVSSAVATVNPEERKCLLLECL